MRFCAFALQIKFGFDGIGILFWGYSGMSFEHSAKVVDRTKIKHFGNFCYGVFLFTHKYFSITYFELVYVVQYCYSVFVFKLGAQ